MSSSESAGESDIGLARAAGFSECAITLRRALTTTPAGWALAVWFCWDRVPQSLIGIWLGIFVSSWALSLWVLQDIIENGASLEDHGRRLNGIAALDGLSWGLVTWFLMGNDMVLNAKLSALLCGVIAVNAQVYTSYSEAYYRQIGVIWVVSMGGLMLHAIHDHGILDYAVGLTVFIALITYYTNAVSKRILEGIRLQHANASLAERLRLALQTVQLDAATDALTGQGNRRALDQLLKQQVALFVASGKPFSILMLDIDFFKKINDGFGHMVGDDVLRAFVQRVCEYLRPDDMCARFGGEEFVVVLPGTRLETAYDVAERLRMGVARVPLIEIPMVQITVSIGVATMKAGQTVDELLATADSAVYSAKSAGRNQVHTR